MSIRIMTKVWESRGTRGSLRLVLLAIADQANDQGVCWPSLGTIARKAGCSRAYAKQLVKELEETGYLSIEHRRIDDQMNDTNLYSLNLLRLGMGGREAGLPRGREAGLPGVGNQGYPKPSFNHNEEEEYENRPNIFKLYEDNIGALSPLLAQKLIDAESTYPQEYIDAAFLEAVRNNKRSWSYVEAILKRWHTAGGITDSRGKVKRKKFVDSDDNYFEVHR